jgi:H+/Cl- antiporter ClcA
MMTFMLVPRELVEADDPPFAFRLLVIFGIFSLLALALLVAADLLLDFFRPQRTRNWLLIATPLLTVLIPGAVIASGFPSEIGVFSQIDPVMLAFAGVAAALTWWSDLPVRNAQLAHVFE